MNKQNQSLAGINRVQIKHFLRKNISLHFYGKFVSQYGTEVPSITRQGKTFNFNTYFFESPAIKLQKIKELLEGIPRLNNQWIRTSLFSFSLSLLSSLSIYPITIMNSLINKLTERYLECSTNKSCMIFVYHLSFLKLIFNLISLFMALP